MIINLLKLLTHPQVVIVILELIKLLGPKLAAQTIVMFLSQTSEEEKNNPPKTEEERVRLFERLRARFANRTGSAS